VRLVLALFIAAIATPGVARAEDEAPARRVALIGLDSLGIDAEQVARLETLFRVEIERLSGAPLPSRRQIQRALARPEHRGCGFEARCMVSVGRALGVDVVVAGNVAALGDASVVNIKAIAVADGAEMARVASEPLRGNRDDLIARVRVAAYQLLAPERMRGAIAVLVDLDGAEVRIDGERVGLTPLPGPVGGLTPGPHRLEVSARDFAPETRAVAVEFEKTTRVVVSLTGEAPRPFAPRPAPEAPFYRSRWFWTAVGVGVAAAALGAIIGSRLGGAEVVMCPGSDDRC
jgi:hypothetical protein